MSLDSLKKFIEKEIQFYKDGGSPKIVIVALEEVLEKVGDLEKTHVTIPKEIIPREIVLRIARKFCVGHPMNELCRLLLDKYEKKERV